ncbi:hypothetical protein Trydic_g5258 [Trypoxylus dichotomus]
MRPFESSSEKVQQLSGQGCGSARERIELIYRIGAKPKSEDDEFHRCSNDDQEPIRRRTTPRPRGDPSVLSRCRRKHRSQRGHRSSVGSPYIPLHRGDVHVIGGYGCDK